MTSEDAEKSVDFIREKVAADIAGGKSDGAVVTRFPPEPNGYLHIGHAKAFCLDFSIAAENGGECHLRFDDTDPVGEDVEYVDAIMEDVRWLGFDWGDHLYFASDYFSKLYDFAEELIKKDKAYICELSMDEFKEYRAVPTRPGKESPSRNRPIDESLDIFARMKAGEFEDGKYVLRGKVDMASPNLHMRDPVLYRIKRAHHHRTGDEWCIYPTYDFAHCLSDSIEKVTHSLCTLEFEVHRPLYDWILAELDAFRSEQTEFARLNMSYTVMSKRKLKQLVEEESVSGWDDPRMPTLCGLRRRGFTAASIRSFIKKVGITKFDGLTDIALLEHCIRDELNKTAERRMCVLNPVKVVIENYPEGESEELDAVNNPEDESAGSRKVPFSKTFYIEREDFMEEPKKKFFRLAPGREVRLRYAYFVTCTGFVKDENGEVAEIHCTYDPATRGGDAPDGRKVKGTIHWVSAEHAGEVEVRLYDRLFMAEKPDDEDDFRDNLNPDSLAVLTCMAEPSLMDAEPGWTCQFERRGYFCVDSKDSEPGKPVFNRIVPLRDAWGRKKR